MIGLDTNVLVRFIAQDDPIHSPKANSVLSSLSAEEPG
jgi:predicted nucleic-acid-binding protein